MRLIGCLIYPRIDFADRHLRGPFGRQLFRSKLDRIIAFMAGLCPSDQMFQVSSGARPVMYFE